MLIGKWINSVCLTGQLIADMKIQVANYDNSSC